MKKALIVFLIMAFVGVGAALIFGQKGRSERSGGRGFGGFGGRGFERLAAKLNLSDEQKTQVKTILEESKTRVQPLTAALRENRKQSENLGIDGAFNEEQVNQLAAGQAETMRQLFIEKERAKAQVFAVLTPEQRAEAAKMKELFRERSKDGFNRRRGGGKREVPAEQE